MLRALYTFLLRLLLPGVGVLFWWRGRRNPALWVNLRERLGHGGQASRHSFREGIRLVGLWRGRAAAGL